MMRLLIDSADLEEIARIHEFYPVDGVTTDPTMLSLVPGKPFEVLGNIRKLIGEEAELYVQTVGRTAEEIVTEANVIYGELGGNTIIRVPALPSGFKAMEILKEQGIRTSGVIVHTPLSAYLSLKAGAESVSPYVRRIGNMGEEEAEMVRRIIGASDGGKVILSDLRTKEQVMEFASYGAYACSCIPEMFDQFMSDPAAFYLNDQFRKDFETAAGKGHTMKDML